MGILDSLTGITGDGNHDSILGNFGKKFQKYTDPLAMIGGDKYVNLTSVEIPRLVNTGLSKVMQPFEKIDKTINPVRRYVPGVDKISNVIADKPGSAIGTVVGGIFAAPALGIGGAGAAGGGAAGGGAGAIGGGGGIAGGSAAGYGGGVASSVLPGIMEGGTVGASYGGASGLGAFGGSVGTGSLTGAGSAGGLGLSSAGGMDWSSMLQQQSGSGQSNSSQASNRQSDSDFKRWQDEQKQAIAQTVADASHNTSSSAYPTDYGFGTNLSLLQGDA